MGGYTLGPGYDKCRSVKLFRKIATIPLAITMNYLFLILLWTAWCSLHSVTASITVSKYLMHLLKTKSRYYRLLFNLAAIATAIPAVLYNRSIESRLLFQWSGICFPLQIVLLIIAVSLFFAGAKRYDLLQLCGIRQIQTGNTHGVLAQSGAFDATGILGITRHPWYLAMILFLWARDLYLSGFIANCVLTIYLITGTLLEEKKLVREFGREYQEYQKRVSMLFPFRFFKAKIVKTFLQK